MSSEEGRRPTGRPRKHPPGRIHVSSRFTPDVYGELKEAAAASRRSLSEEIEHRVQEREIYKRLLGDLENIPAITPASMPITGQTITPIYSRHFPEAALAATLEAVLVKVLPPLVEAAVAKAMARTKVIISGEGK